MLELWYFTWVLSVIRSLFWYLTFWPSHLTILKNWHWSSFLKNKILEFPYCTWSFLMTRSFCWYQNIFPCHLGHQWNWNGGHLCFTNTSCSTCPLLSFFIPRLLSFMRSCFPVDTHTLVISMCLWMRLMRNQHLMPPCLFWGNSLWKLIVLNTYNQFSNQRSLLTSVFVERGGGWGG